MNELQQTTSSITDKNKQLEQTLQGYIQEIKFVYPLFLIRNIFSWKPIKIFQVENKSEWCPVFIMYSSMLSIDGLAWKSNLKQSICSLSECVSFCRLDESILFYEYYSSRIGVCIAQRSRANEEQLTFPLWLLFCFQRNEVKTWLFTWRWRLILTQFDALSNHFSFYDFLLLALSCNELVCLF